MKALKPLLIILCFLVGCDRQNHKLKSQDSITIKQMPSKDYSGIYLNEKKNTISFKLKKITELNYYFELSDTDKSNPLLAKRQILGMLKLVNDTFEIINTTESLTNFITVINNGNIIIDSTELKIYTDFKDIIGFYSKRNSEVELLPNYNLFIGPKWDEGQFQTSALIPIYLYPSIFSNSQRISVQKGDWANTYIDVYNKDSLGLDFAYVNLKNTSGWMSVRDYYTTLQRVYQCERDSSGIQKWNKMKRYTLYFTPQGKFIKKEFD